MEYDRSVYNKLWVVLCDTLAVAPLTVKAHVFELAASMLRKAGFTMDVKVWSLHECCRYICAENLVLKFEEHYFVFPPAAVYNQGVGFLQIWHSCVDISALNILFSPHIQTVAL